tara:strand:+ start:960 stop:1607 length:648 start_codon:yes stop_codon:yes gene_type:complete
MSEAPPSYSSLFKDVVTKMYRTRRCAGQQDPVSKKNIYENEGVCWPASGRTSGNVDDECGTAAAPGTCFADTSLVRLVQETIMRGEKYVTNPVDGSKVSIQEITEAMDKTLPPIAKLSVKDNKEKDEQWAEKLLLMLPGGSDGNTTVYGDVHVDLTVVNEASLESTECDCSGPCLPHCYKDQMQELEVLNILRQAVSRDQYGYGDWMWQVRRPAE